MAPISIAKLDFKIQKKNIRAQKIDGLSLKIYKIIQANY